MFSEVKHMWHALMHNISILAKFIMALCLATELLQTATNKLSNG